MMSTKVFMSCAESKQSAGVEDLRPKTICDALIAREHRRIVRARKVFSVRARVPRSKASASALLDAPAMKTQFIASTLAMAFGLLACAAPSGTEGEEETAKTEKTEKTEETSSELRIGGLNNTCALTCSGGNQTCCCDVGQKCESGATYCVCKSATDTRFNLTFAQ